MQDFEPLNELEEQLMQAQSGQTEAEAFMEVLFRSQVFMPIQDVAEQGQEGRDAGQVVSLVLQGLEGKPAVVLFTSPERASVIQEDFPDFTGGLQADFSWILEKIGDDVGILLNPRWDVGIEMAPKMLQELAGIAIEQGTKNTYDA